MKPPNPSHVAFLGLRDVLAKLYNTPDISRMKVEEAGLDAANIEFSNRAETNWHNILVSVDKLQSAISLREVTYKDFGRNTELRKKWESYIRVFTPSSIFLSYDWEDRWADPLENAHKDRVGVAGLVKELKRRGIQIAWDQDWPYWEDRANKLDETIRSNDILVVYSTASSQHSEWVKEEIEIAKRQEKQILVLDREPGKRPHLISNADGVDVEGLKLAQIIDAITENMHPVVHESEPQPDNRTVQELLDAALKANEGIPSDTIMDKIFLSPKAGQLVEEAYARSSKLGMANPQRLRAMLEYARLKRFQGAWTTAEDVMVLGMDFSETKNSDFLPTFELELGALRFERGLTTQGKKLVHNALSRFQSQGITTSLVVALRQLGNMLREESQWADADRHLTAAMYIAEYLKDAESLGPEHVPISKEARRLLWLDCRRERAALLLLQEKADEAISIFKDTLGFANSEGLSSHAEYLRGIILYQLGRAYMLHKHDVNKAIQCFDESVRILHKYDNPIRLSFVYDARGKALIQQPPFAKFDTARQYLETAERVRTRSNHSYFVAYTWLGIGDLLWAERNVQGAIAKYEESKEVFSNLNKPRDLAITCFKLGKSYAQSNNREIAHSEFTQAEELFRDIAATEALRQVHFELHRLDHPGNIRDMDLEKLIESATAEKHHYVLDEIGEYTFHSWIRKHVEKSIPDRSLLTGAQSLSAKTVKVQPADTDLRRLIHVGIGDDAAVLGIPGSAFYDLVLTTDAAPGSICRLPDDMAKKTRGEIEAAAQYAAKFSVVHCISDILAMGATPVALLLNLYLTREATLEYAMTVIKTVVQEAAGYGAVLIGGDLKERKEQSIGCVGIGVVAIGHSIRRKGAEPGHILAITQASMPEEIGGIRRIGCRWAQEIIEDRKLRSIEPYADFVSKNWKRDLLFLPYKQMLAGAATGCIQSAIDTSDGFLSCLEILGRDSKVGFILEESLIEDIIDDNVKQIAAALGLRPAQFLFNAGHDWEIVLTTNRNQFEELRDVIRRTGGDLSRLGRVCDLDELSFTDSSVARPLETGIALVSSNTKEKFWIPFFTDEKFVQRAYEDRPTEWIDLKPYLEGSKPLR